MRARRSAARIWAAASALEVITENAACTRRPARGMRDGEGEVAGLGGGMEPAEPRIKFPRGVLRAPGGLRPRETGVCFGHSGQGGCWGDAQHRGWEGEWGRLPPADALLREAFPAYESSRDEGVNFIAHLLYRR